MRKIDYDNLARAIRAEMQTNDVMVHWVLTRLAVILSKTLHVKPDEFLKSCGVNE